MTPRCPWCPTVHDHWRTVVWHLTIEHEERLRAVWDRDYGLLVVDPVDADASRLTEPQAREVIASLWPTRPGVPAEEWQARAYERDRHRAGHCDCCHRAARIHARGLCRSCYARAQRHRTLHLWGAAA